MEKLNNPFLNCELKFDAGNKGIFEGYASKFGNIDKVLDTILPGAYAETIKENPHPKMFINHDSWGIPTGRWEALSEDKHGLYVKGRVNLEHRDGPTLYSAMKNGDMDALSIGFNIPAGGAEEKENGIRIISKINLKEISVVNFPADEHARISVVKSEIETIESLREAEQFLRDSGIFSKSAAMAFVSRIRTLARSDSGNAFKHEITMLEKRLMTQNATDSLLATLRKL